MEQYVFRGGGGGGGSEIYMNQQLICLVNLFYFTPSSGIKYKE